MKKLIQYTAYLVPIVFAAVCLALFCRFYQPCQGSLNKVEYATSGNLPNNQVTQFLDSET